MRTLPTLLLLAVLSFAVVTAAARSPAPQDRPPNIIAIMADDLGFSDLGCYGGEIATPHLDRLAGEGIRFTRFYNEAKCVESRTALMTGHTHHVSNNLKDRSIPTVAERLNDAGYRTLMVGKWHMADSPTERGFDRSFGFLEGAVNFWMGEGMHGRDGRWRLDGEPFEVPESGFYTTDAFTDYAIDFIEETQETQQPFFLYLAHNAPHYPLHAHPEDIEKYRGSYLKGWDRIREERWLRLQNLGLISPELPLSSRDRNVPFWEKLSADEKAEYDLLMAVYAAMIDRLDQNIGRLVAYLEAQGLSNNTLILFFSDNGGCPYQNEEKPDSIPGGPESHRTYNTPWANASNTPFRLYKRHSHEGGISSPFIARWPAAIKAAGSIRREPAHITDLLPTFLEIATGDAPDDVAGQSLLPALTGQAPSPRGPIFWEFAFHHAVLKDGYKLVARRGEDWQLYHILTDRIESRNLAPQKPDLVAELAAAYDSWAERVGAPAHHACLNQRFNPMKDYTKILGQP